MKRKEVVEVKNKKILLVVSIIIFILVVGWMIYFGVKPEKETMKPELRIPEKMLERIEKVPGKPLEEKEYTEAEREEEIRKWVAIEAERARRWLPHYIKTLKEGKHPGGRTRAVLSLGYSRDPRAVEPLIKALETDVSVRVRTEAAFALGVVLDKESLRLAGKKSDAVLRLRKKVIPVLEKALSREVDKGVILNSAVSLVKLGGNSDAVSVLIDLAKGKGIEEWKAEGMVTIGEAAGEELRTKLIEQVKRRIRQDALYALKEAGTDTAILVIKEVSRDKNVPESVRRVAKNILRESSIK